MKNNISKLIQGKKQQGFTLIELAIVIVIIGVLMAGFFQGVHLYLAKKKLTDTDSNIEAVRLALADYVRNETSSDPTDQVRFPCPSSIKGTSAGNSELANCVNYAPPNPAPALGEISNGVWAVNSPSGDVILVGGVPTGTLGISGKYAYDGYGNKLVYAVTLNLVEDGILMASDVPNGAVVVESFDPNAPAGTPPSRQTVDFLVFSPGKAGQGAYKNASAAFAPCGVVSADSQNCSWQGNQTSANAGIFRSENAFSLNDPTTSAQYYDDKMIFSLNGENDDEWWGAIC